MKVIVIFDLAEISDPNSQEATDAIEILSDELRVMDTLGYDWYIDDAMED